MKRPAHTQSRVLVRPRVKRASLRKCSASLCPRAEAPRPSIPVRAEARLHSDALFRTDAVAFKNTSVSMRLSVLKRAACRSAQHTSTPARAEVLICPSALSNERSHMLIYKTLRFSLSLSSLSSLLVRSFSPVLPLPFSRLPPSADSLQERSHVPKRVLFSVSTYPKPARVDAPVRPTRCFIPLRCRIKATTGASRCRGYHVGLALPRLPHASRPACAASQTTCPEAAHPSAALAGFKASHCCVNSARFPPAAAPGPRAVPRPRADAPGPRLRPFKLLLLRGHYCSSHWRGPVQVAAALVSAAYAAARIEALTARPHSKTAVHSFSPPSCHST